MVLVLGFLHFVWLDVRLLTLKNVMILHCEYILYAYFPYASNRNSGCSLADNIDSYHIVYSSVFHFLKQKSMDLTSFLITLFLKGHFGAVPEEGGTHSAPPRRAKNGHAKYPGI